MNNYTQKVDKVGIDEVFPYPIKLTYDNEYVYLTVLRIPEPEELKLSPWVMNQLNKGHEISDYSNRLILCIERDNPRKYNLDKRPPYHPYPGNAPYKGHPSKGGNFSMVNMNDEEIIPEIGHTYQFSIDSCLNRIAYHNKQYNDNGEDIYPVYSKIRGTFRFNVRHPRLRPTSGNDKNTQQYEISQTFTPLYERTGIYSNTVEIKLS